MLKNRENCSQEELILSVKLGPQKDVRGIAAKIIYGQARQLKVVINGKWWK